MIQIFYTQKLALNGPCIQIYKAAKSSRKVMRFQRWTHPELHSDTTPGISAMSFWQLCPETSGT